MRSPIVDAHLDIAWNHLQGRDQTIAVAELRRGENRTSRQAMVTLPELIEAGVAVAFATLYTGAWEYDDDGYGIYAVPPDEDARKQLDCYLGWESEGRVRIIRSRSDLSSHLDAWATDSKPGLVILIEGADSISSPEDLPKWVADGVRIIGPAWSQTRYCGGTRRPGPLTAAGKELLAGMKELGVICDISHMAEESFWQTLELDNHRVIATHANARALVPKERPDRHLSDEMLAALGETGAVIGVVLANAFLDETWTSDADPLGMDVVKSHLYHMAAIVGWSGVGIGSDLDGGFGVEETPSPFDSVADLHKIGGIVPGSSSDAVLGGNWLRVLSESLP